MNEELLAGTNIPIPTKGLMDEFGRPVVVQLCIWNPKFPCAFPKELRNESILNICQICKIERILRIMSRLEKEIRTYMLKTGVVSEEDLDLGRKEK